MPREMKDSGIEWLGQTPIHWNTKKAFQIFSQVKNKNEGLVETNLLSLSYGKIKRKSIDTVEGLLPESFDGYNIIEANDIVLRLTDLQNDHTSLRVGLSNERGIITSAYLTLRCNSNNYPKYLYYYLHSFDIAKGFYGMGAGVRQGLNWDGVKSLQILIPSIPEQKAIADFLDKQCAEIDTVIAKTKATIEEYKKLRQSIITEAVTKGIRGDRPVKDSGIEWIGEIPSEWDCLKAKYLFQEGDGSLKIGPFGSALNGKTLAEGTYKIYNQAHLVSNDFSLSRHFVSESTFEELKSYEVKAGDVLFSMMGTIGKCRIMPSGYCKGIMDSHLLKARLNELIDVDYFVYVYDKDNSSIGIGQLNYFSNGSIMSGLNSTIVKNIYIPLPPKEEQKEIVEYLKIKCSEIDKLISSKTTLLEEMETYKKSVIYEYVTGKKEVC